MGAKIEVFSDGSPVSDRVVDQVKELSCSKCEINVYHTNEQGGSADCEDKVKAYGITSIPAVVFNGKLVDVHNLKQVKETMKHS